MRRAVYFFNDAIECKANTEPLKWDNKSQYKMASLRNDFLLTGN